MSARDEASFRRALGTRLRAARVAAGWTQRELAERADLADRYLSRLELGLAMPSVWVVARLARHLGVSLDALVGASSAAESTRRAERVQRALASLTSAEVETVLRMIAALRG